MTSVTIVQVSIEETDKEKHSSNWDMKKNSKKKVSAMKNDESSEYSETTEVVDEKK